MVRTRGQSVGGGGGIATGTYTGDGAATQAIIGVGFQPRFVIVFRNATTSLNATEMAMKADVDGGANSTVYYFMLNSWYWQINNDIVSLDADGFTVADTTPIWGFNSFNIVGVHYTYMAFR